MADETTTLRCTCPNVCLLHNANTGRWETFEHMPYMPMVSMPMPTGVRFIPNEAADPAQSAPSAEPLDPEKFLYERLGFTFKAINSSLTVTIFRPEFKIFSFSQYDGKWDVVYLMDDAWKLLVELAAEKQAAALRTAQLERELQDARKPHEELWTKYEAEVDKWSRRAETAESDLANARNDIEFLEKELEGDKNDY